MLEHDKPVTRAWVLYPNIRNQQKRRDPDAALQEAVSLAEALPDLDVIGQGVIGLPKVSPGYLFGSGKIEELAGVLKEADVELVLVDGPVTPVQQRNLEKAWKVKLLDRTSLILEIFGDRARTSEGVLQVEMAALTYQRTRLVRAWTHLERQRGGLGFVGGPGETQIEADRRAIDDQLGRLRKQLAKVVKTRSLHRASRAKVPFPIVALVGYTNAGKSTLFNRVTGSDVFAKDMLFATLDPTMRRIELPEGEEVILSDTVGFISDLPTELVAAFRATLEEVLDADLLVHVRDISHENSQEQSDDVNSILENLGVDQQTPRLEVWNKIDLLSDDERYAALDRAAQRDDLFAVSAISGDGVSDLLNVIATTVSDPFTEEEITLNFSEGKKRAWLFEAGVVASEHQDESGYNISVSWSQKQRAQFQKVV